MQEIESPTIYLTDHLPRDKTTAEFFDDFTAMQNTNDDLLENSAVASGQSERELQYVSAESNPMNETQSDTWDDAVSDWDFAVKQNADSDLLATDHSPTRNGKNLT